MENPWQIYGQQKEKLSLNKFRPDTDLKLRLYSKTFHLKYFQGKRLVFAVEQAQVNLQLR